MNDWIDIDGFKACLELCRCQMTDMFASSNAPETILVLKGNKALGLQIHRWYRVVIYAPLRPSWTPTQPE